MDRIGSDTLGGEQVAVRLVVLLVLHLLNETHRHLFSFFFEFFFTSRACVVGCAGLGMILSLVAATGCSFLTFKNNISSPYGGLGEPFEGATEANVGIFNYEVVKVNYDSAGGSCEGYPPGANYEVLVAGKIVGVGAPLVAMIAVLITAYDTCVGHNIGCFIGAAFTYLIACGLQACTFVLFAEPTFW